MRFFNCLVFFIFFSANVHAQQIRYIYIQTENKQAFYVRLNEKVLSSTASGYLIIPKLTDGTYKLTIGFPKKEWPAQNIDITINGKDQGYLLKNFGEKGWVLFNMQTMDVLMGTPENTIYVPVPENKTDAFSNTLAEVTNTASIKQVEVVTKTAETISADTSKAIAKEEIKKADSIAPATLQQIGQVFSILDNSGRATIYAINEGSNADTVRLFIPYNNKDTNTVNAITTAVKEEIKENKKQTDSAVTALTVKTDSIAITSKPANDDIQKPVEDKTVITDVKVNDSNAVNKNGSGITKFSLTIVNPACNKSATEQDFSKLQKKMTEAGGDEAKIMLASKAFKSKCFTTEQVKMLSTLFSNDEGRYNFYDAAYSHVSDIGNFKVLQSQLSEEYYLNRFKAMLR